MAEAIALLVVGSGETTEAEVGDLLDAAYPASDYDVDLFVPVDKDLFTKTVQHAVSWFNSDGDVYTIKTEGASLSRASSKIGEKPDEVESLLDILDPKEFKDWEEVHLLVALPEDQDDPDFDFYVSLVERAIENEIPVKDLKAGLDDVRIADDEPEEPETDPEPPKEEEKPKRTRRSRKSEPVSEDEERFVNEDGNTKEAPEEPLEESLAKASHQVAKEAAEKAFEVTDGRFKYHPPTEEARVMHETARYRLARFTEWVEVLGEPSRERSLAVTKIEEALFWLNAHIARNITGSEAPEASGEPQEAAEEPEKPKRGRPRKHFEVKQVWDEDEGEWIPRPRGRIAKGTKTRTIHAETEEVLEEGTA